MQNGTEISPGGGAQPRETNGDQTLEVEGFGSTIILLRSICEVADEVDRMASRRPQDAPAIAKRQKAMCLACPHNPSRVFPALNTVLLEDLTKFQPSFKGEVEALRDFTPLNETCLDCCAKTVGDFEHLYRVFERLVRDALKRGRSQ